MPAKDTQTVSGRRKGIFKMKTINDLLAKYPDSERLEDMGQFSCVTTDPEESAWYCNLCGSLECDPYEGYCEGCAEEDDDYCTTCSGSGEGQHCGTRCPACKGKGVKTNDDYEAAIDRAEYERDQER